MFDADVIGLHFQNSNPKSLCQTLQTQKWKKKANYKWLVDAMYLRCKFPGNCILEFPSQLRRHRVLLYCWRQRVRIRHL